MTPDRTPPVDQATFDALTAALRAMTAEVDSGLRKRDDRTYRNYRLCVDELVAKWPQYIAVEPVEVDQ